MNKVMNEENRRHGGRNTLCRLFRSGRWFLCLALLCSVMLPGFADAASAGDGFCKNLDGNDIRLNLPPSVSFVPDTDFPPYTSPPVYINYQCTTNGTATVAITLLADLNPLTDALGKAGLKLEVLVTDSSGGGGSTWIFTGDKNKIDHINIGTPYTNDTKVRTMTIRMKVSRDTSALPPDPGFYAIPSLSSFKLVPYYSSFQGPFIITPPLRLQYVPTCFVQTVLPTNNVNFGPVLTTDADNSFSRKIPFTVTANVNKSCNSGQFGNLQTGYKPDLTGAQIYYLNLPLKVSFILNNGGAISADNKSIILHKKGTETENGLQLKITDGSGAPVTFGEISTTGSIPPPANQFGEFQGSDSGGSWNISNTYHAVLSSTGKPVITGSYSAQVTVKVEYY
uniref:Fimbrial protein n=1 Tax=Salmonella enterica TaxID=28901 RepID=A0A744JK11_SALER|nr:fimbrial protein [Salmonella enterica]